jgi:hypothetical protein
MPDYSSQEALEHVERTHELLSHSESAILRLTPLMAAILAILAGLSSLYAGRLGERVLTLKNEAVLHEVTSSDLWSEYQAESIKGHLYAISAQSQSGKTAAATRATAAAYKAEQLPLRAQARRNEALRDEELNGSTALEKNKTNFQIALALFEVAIVLTSIAAMVKRFWLIVLAAVGGVAALVLCVLGMLGR